MITTILISSWVVYNIYKVITIDRRNDSSNEVFINNMIEKINTKLNHVEVLDLVKLLGMMTVVTSTVISLSILSTAYDYLQLDVLYFLITIGLTYVTGYDWLSILSSTSYVQVFKIIFVNNDIAYPQLKLVIHIACSLIGLVALYNM